MKRILLVLPIFVLVAMTSCGRHSSDSAVGADASSSVSTNANLVRVAVIGPGTVERMRTLLTNAQIEVALNKIVIEAGAVQDFPPGSYSVSVPEEAKPQAISLIRQDAPKGKYWIQVQP